MQTGEPSKLLLELSEASFDCLLEHASEALPQVFQRRAGDNKSGYVSLVHPTSMQVSQVNIFCTEEQAKELLAIAERDCTGAISAIKTGIRLGEVWLKTSRNR